MPNFWLVAGPNGAGKTTVTSSKPFRDLLGGVWPLNPDALVPGIRIQKPELSLVEANLEAAYRVEAEVDRRIQCGEELIVETVLSSRKYLPKIQLAKELGFHFHLIYISVPDVETSVARVRERVAEGGHDVPLVKLHERFPRTHDNMAKLLPLCDSAYILSNAHYEQAARLVAMKEASVIRLLDAAALPEVTDRLQLLMD